MKQSDAHMVLEWKIPPGQVRPITAALNSVMLETRLERGCVCCSLATSVADLVTLRYVEDWESEDGLRRHVQSDGFRALAGLVESATETPRIEFALPGGTRGVDYATEVRQSAPEPDVTLFGLATAEGHPRPRRHRPSKR